MDRLISENQIQSIINYVLSVPTGSRPAGDAVNLVQSLQRLPQAVAPEPGTTRKMPPAPEA